MPNLFQRLLKTFFHGTKESRLLLLLLLTGKFDIMKCERWRRLA
jgi:hypothetical protein